MRFSDHCRLQEAIVTENVKAECHCRAILGAPSLRQAIDDKSIEITGFNAAQLNPNSYDLRLAKTVIIYDGEELDAAVEPSFTSFEIPEEGLRLRPGQLYLMSTEEVVKTSKYVPLLEGRSSVARLGISVHESAGFGDAGFHGTWTLEVRVAMPVRIYAGMRFCQVYFLTTDVMSAEDLYQGKYNGQATPRISGIWKERDEWIRKANEKHPQKPFSQF